MDKADTVMQAIATFALLGAAALYAIDGILYEVKLMLDALKKDRPEKQTKTK